MGGMTAQIAPLLAALVDKAPEAEDVVAGWGAFGIFIGLCLAVAFLGWSLNKQLKKTQRNAEKGVFAPSDEKPRRTSV
jgi:hypothetical protein